ncbi:hypothetical protein C8F01DRAFT_1162082, partial [Mycena amicta]
MMSPVLPEDLEREIFETTAQLHPAGIPTLLRVARRVHIWLGPFLYRVICVSEFPQRAVLFDTMRYYPEVLQQGVRYLCFDPRNTLSTQDIAHLLALCPLVVDLVLLHGYSILDNLPHIARMQDLRRVTCTVRSLFGSLDAIDFARANGRGIFSRVTHLELVETSTFIHVQHDAKWSRMLRAFPSLTHMSWVTPQVDDLSWLRVQKTLDMVPQLRIFVFIWIKDTLYRPFTQVNAAPVRDIRFMAGSYAQGQRGRLWVEWEDSAKGMACDYWDRGEMFLERKQKCEIDASQVWMD